MNRLIIWHEPSKNSYYYKQVKGAYAKYKVGYRNTYGHEIIMVIEIDFTLPKTPLKQRLIKRMIRFLEKKLR